MTEVEDEAATGPVRRRPPPTVVAAAAIAGLAAIIAVLGFAGCTSWDPRHPFERNAPDVDEAIAAMEGGAPERAVERLVEYLGTGPCREEGIGLPDAVRRRADASFDLGLALFQLAETYGARFTAAPSPSASGAPPFPLGGAPNPPDDAQAETRGQTIACALTIVGAIASDPEVPIDLRARAFYLAGNLEFLREDFEKAVKQYDLALQLLPGFPAPEGEGGAAGASGKDPIGADAAWNRSIALFRQQEIENQQPPPPEPQPDDENQTQEDPDDSEQPDDGGEEPEGDDGDADDDGDEPGDEDDDAAPQDGDDGDTQDQGDEEEGDDEGAPATPPPPEPGADEGIDDSGEEEKQASLEALLDEFESAPTYQEEEAKKRSDDTRRRRVMEDK
ncbi:MAG: tetratricopeptide repeat protein [Myxococcota bacterium]